MSCCVGTGEDYRQNTEAERLCQELNDKYRKTNKGCNKLLLLGKFDRAHSFIYHWCIRKKVRCGLF